MRSQSLLLVSSALSIALVCRPAGAAGEGGSGGTAGGSHRVPTHVACVGDSITAGFGAQTLSYVGNLIQMFSTAKVAGFGHSGATMLSNSVEPTEPYEIQPEYNDATTFVAAAGTDAVVDVIIMLGTNDAAPQNWPTAGTSQSAAQFVSDYNAMLDRFMNLSTHPVIYMVLPPTAYLADPTLNNNLHDGVIPLIKQVAAARGVALIDVNTPTAGHPEDSADGLHPNDAGHLLIAQIMYAALLDMPIPTPIPGSGGAPGTSGGAGGASGGTTSGGTASGGAAQGGTSAQAGASGSAAAGGASKPSAAKQSGGCSLSGPPRSAGAPVGLLLGAWLYGRSRRRRAHHRD